MLSIVLNKLLSAEVIGCGQPGLCDTGNLPAVQAQSSQLQIILQIVFGIIGVLAVIYIVMAGFKLMTSLGNPEALAKARQGIIFAVVGLVVALSAELIISFTIKQL